MSQWVDACSVDDLEPEDVIGFEHQGKLYAICRSPQGEFFATAGLCTHEEAEMADGMVFDNIIECPMHNGRFDYRTGKAVAAPACVDLATFPTKVENGRVLIDIGP